MKKFVRIEKELNLYNIENIVRDLYNINTADQDGRIKFSANEG